MAGSDSRPGRRNYPAGLPPAEPDGGFRMTERLTVRLTPDELWYVRTMASFMQGRSGKRVTESEVVRRIVNTMRWYSSTKEFNIHERMMEKYLNGHKRGSP